MNLPEGVTLISQENPTGFYSLAPSCGSVFRFVVPIGGFIIMTVAKVPTYSQDFSVRLWFSKAPWGPPAAYLGRSSQFALPVGPIGINYIVHDWEAAGVPTYTASLKFPVVPGIFYANIQNLSNISAIYEFIFQ